jgi:hypothetical protein
MTIRVDRVAEEDVDVFYVSGRIEAEDLDVLRSALVPAGGPLVLDLKGVDLIDRAALEFLAGVEGAGGALRSCPPFIREWIDRERAEARPTESEHGHDIE